LKKENRSNISPGLNTTDSDEQHIIFYRVEINNPENALEGLMDRISFFVPAVVAFMNKRFLERSYH
jgi:hypothetical protein